MDWPKIKSILLVLLVITNVVLGIMLFLDYQNFYVNKEDTLKTVLEFYEENERPVLVSDLEYPSKIYSITTDFSGYAISNKSVANNALFDMSKIQALLGNEMRYYVRGKSISIAKTGKLNRTIQSYVYKPGLRQTEDIRSMFESVEGGIGLKESYMPISYNQYEGYVVVEAKQSVKDILVDESTGYFWFKEGVFVGMQLMNPSKIKVNYNVMYDIIGIDTALYKGFHKITVKEPVVSIELFYKFNDADLFSGEIVKGDPLPYYRVETKSGKIYYFEALKPLN